MEFTIIDQNSPDEIVFKVFQRLGLLLSDLRTEYPYFQEWLSKVQDELIHSTQRVVILCFEKNILDIKGLAILKRSNEENKICTLRVVDSYKRRGIGQILLMNSKYVLRDQHPLITVSGKHMKEFAPFLKVNGFVLKDKVKSIYRKGAYEYFFNVAYHHTNVLLSIQPKYAEKIAEGLKKVEFRKSIFADTVTTVYVYSSSPIKQIIGFFNITDIVKDTPQQLWSLYSNVGYISYDDYVKYYKGHEQAYGILINKFIKFSKPLNPKEYDPAFRAPQSYSYIDNVEAINWLNSQNA